MTEEDLGLQQGGEGEGRQQGEGQEPEGGEGEGTLDKHGQPGINKERHDREVAELNATIAELQGKLDDAAETRKGRDELRQQLDELKAKMADSDVTHALELAGCRNAKAAKALLGDYGDDVAKLKAECPYLFREEKKTGSTGRRPAGSADALDDKLDRAFGLEK